MIEKDGNLLRAAQIMYEFQNRCLHRYFCPGCAAYKGRTCRLKAGKDGVPAGWDITTADLQRLEARASNERSMLSQ
jgi:hypothetical protein